jgi:hypothetical protein
MAVDHNAYLAYQREYRAKNKERLAEQKRRYYLANKERIKASQDRRRDQKRRNDRLYHRANREKHRERKLAYQKRYRSGRTQRLAHNLRNRLSKFIRRKSGRASTEVLLGCSFEEFAAYLERKFTRSMTWENYGKVWHVDHIIPVSAFDLTDPEQVRRCFHFSNLRPLDARANLRKNAKIVDPQYRLLL